MKKKIIGILLFLAGAGVAIFAGMICYLQFTEYRPAAIEMIQTSGKGHPLEAGRTEFSFLSWNIGYAGLGKNMDYFYDGGKRVQCSREETDENFRGICDRLKSSDSIDFFMVQEIDKDSKRTYGTDQAEGIGKALPGFCSAYAVNYKVGFIPVPITEPIGKVNSGLCTFSKYPPESCERHAYDAFFSWPKRLMFLKRCFLASVYTVAGGKQLIVINLHNSAFDQTGELRSRELAMLQDYLEREYRNGSYIIVGGDWNMNPRGFEKDSVKSGDRVFSITPAMDASFMPGWQLVFDPARPSNRNVDISYSKGLTGTTVIDFFLISPNVEVLNCFTVDLGFRNSDHNPVYARFRLLTGTNPSLF